jgi:hypothetical protein
MPKNGTTPIAGNSTFEQRTSLLGSNQNWLFHLIIFKMSGFNCSLMGVEMVYFRGSWHHLFW